MARPIIDFEVERRQMSHAQVYHDVKSIPMYQLDAEQSMEVIKLSKASKKKEPMSFLDCLLLTSSITPENKDADAEFITEIRKYSLSASELAEIKSILVCTISVSKDISEGITNAITDFAAGNDREDFSKKKDTNELYFTNPNRSGLYKTLYDEVYDRLVSICGDRNIFLAACKMRGE